jgi:hydroxypyruvate reductase
MQAIEHNRALLRAMFDAGVASADPRRVLPQYLPEKPGGRCVVVGAGKASAAMAAALDAAWPDVALSGIVVTRYGHAVPAGRIEIIEAAHPVPDAMSEAAARRILAAVGNLRAEDMVIALISGGGSALMVAPAPGMTLAGKQSITRALLASGATISEMNTVRKHLSAIKGGRLALAARPARVVTLVISDVPGDDPAVIASGPTVPDTSTAEQAREIIARYGIELPAAAEAALAAESSERNDFDTDIRMIATPLMALRAAAEVARAAGITPVILGDALEGESRELGVCMAGIARSVALHGLPAGAPAVLLSGGETTVTIGKSKAGRGGRNTAFLLGFALAAQGLPGVWAIAGDSDGIDGTEDAAGAIVAPDTLARGRAAGLNAREFLSAHDSYGYFDAIGDLVRTGPTLTNVNDLRMVLVCG